MSRLNRLLAHPFSWIVILSFSASVILMAAVDVSLALGFHSKENVGMTMFGALIIPFSVAGFATLSGWVVWRTEWVVRKDLWSAIKRFTIGFVVGPLIAYPFFALSISTIVIPLVLFFYVTSISSGLYTYAEYHEL